MTNRIYFDTYAIFEIIKGNNNYDKYTNATIIITKLNLFELFYGILKDYGETAALEALSRYSSFVVDFDNDTIVQAAKLRLLKKKQNISMTDCIGYITARRLGIKFLTGDMQFNDMPEVEFVK